MKPSFLLDTNVIIQFEEVGTDRKIKGPFQELHALLVEHSLVFRYHPLTEEDFETDKDKGRQAEILSRLRKYPKLDKPPLAEGSELEKFFGGIGKTNDLIDCQLLFSLKRNCVTYLISEDAGLHRRVANSDLNERVLFVSEAIELIVRRYKPQTVKLPSVNHEYLYNLDLSIPFFDSLKADYAGFEAWIAKTPERRCWTIRVGSDLAGLCIYKLDESVEHEGILMPSMKLCTFKVSDQFASRKFGELLLKMAHQYAVKNDLASIWVTAHEKQTKLIQFLRNFGFLVHSDLKLKDMVFFKLMNPPADLPPMEPIDFHILYSPHFYDHPAIRKFVIPIQSDFHDTLFPEIDPRLTAPQMMLPGIQSGNSVPGNTIRKVYLCHAKIKEVPSGSLIYFYRSKPGQFLQTMAIVEKSRRLTDMDSLAAAIGKRSVYSAKQVTEMVKKEVLVIDFRVVMHSEKPIALTELVAKKVFNNRPPQSIAELGHAQYLGLKRLWAKNQKPPVSKA